MSVRLFNQAALLAQLTFLSYRLEKAVEMISEVEDEIEQQELNERRKQINGSEGAWNLDI